MRATFKTPNYLQAPIKILSLLTLVILILWSTIGCKVEKRVPIEDIVSFQANVEADSFQKVFTLVIGTKQATSEELNNLLRPAGGKVLMVTSITAFHIKPTIESPFSVIKLMAQTASGSTRGWGVGGLSVSGRKTTHVTYRPGMVVELVGDESLTIRSLIQSNELARVEVHGHLRERPES